MNNKAVYRNRLEIIIIIMFAVCLLTVGYFHEPWFDEAQAWQIAKCESLSRILFHIPHYEGQPPLWHLVLAVPAKIGIPFEIGLKFAGFLFSMASVILLVFKSPFPRFIKLAIPFTYFFFYQYGVIVRPYCMTILAALLCALSFRYRNEHPWRFVLALSFLCGTSTYGIVIAGGIAVCWTSELFFTKQVVVSLKNLLKDSRVHALAFLLLFAVCLILLIIPAKDNSYHELSSDNHNSIILCCVYAFLALLPDSILTTSPWFVNDKTLLKHATISAPSLILLIVVQVILSSVICAYSSKRCLKYFFVPLFFLALFSGIIYLSGHHLGMGFILLAFWLWINSEDENRGEIWEKVKEALHFSNGDSRIMKRFALILTYASVFVSLFWCASASIHDIQSAYGYGRDVAQYLKKNGLTELKIATRWVEGIKDKGDPDFYSKIDLTIDGTPVPILPYFDHNIVYNFNQGKDQFSYSTWRLQEETPLKEINVWKKNGVPDLLLGEVDVELLTDGKYSISDYSPIYRIDHHHFWKTNISSNTLFVLLRNDLLQQYHIEAIKYPDGVVGGSGFAVTDEIRERYENGEDINEILGPALDHLFGVESSTAR